MRKYELKDKDYRDLSELIHSFAGIDLGDEKKELVVARLQSVLRSRGLPDFRSYVDLLRSSKDRVLFSELVDRIATNHTFFNREPAHFEIFSEDVLPEFIERASSSSEKDLRVWCAAASTGEEPYTLMMRIMESLGSAYGAWKAGLLATDLSSEALATAAEGVYEEEAVSSLPKLFRDRYFDAASGGQRRVAARVREEVTFRRFNLIQNDFNFARPFHVTFCRNVLIYFDRPTKQRVIERIYEVTAEGGYLFVGHSESLDRATCPFDYIRPGVYRRGTDWTDR